MDDDMKYICDIIRNSVSALEVGRVLGLNPGHDGRCRCPFHGGDHKNLKLYGPGKGYYCFVCHESGDVIRLVKEYTKCSFMDAVDWLNDSFGLNLDIKKNDPFQRRRRAEAYARRLAKEKEHASHSQQPG